MLDSEAPSLTHRVSRQYVVQRRALPYVLLLPTALVLLGGIAFPWGWCLVLTFYDWSAIRPGQPTFIGLQNYRDTLQSGDFWHSVGLTLLLVALTVPAQMLLGFSFAYLLSTSKRILHLYGADELERAQHRLGELRDGIIAAPGQEEAFEPLPDALNQVQMRAVGGESEQLEPLTRISPAPGSMCQLIIPAMKVGRRALPNLRKLHPCPSTRAIGHWRAAIRC